MRKNLGLKLAAIVLAAVCLVGALACGLGVIYLGEKNLYSQTPEERNRGMLADMACGVADSVAVNYAVKKLTNNGYHWSTSLNSLYYDYSYAESLLQTGMAMYTLRDDLLTETNYDAAKAEGFLCFDLHVNVAYPVALEAGSPEDEELKRDLGLEGEPTNTFSEPAVTWPADETNKVLTNVTVSLEQFRHSDYRNIGGTMYHIYFFQAPEYRVTVWLSPNAGDIYYGSHEVELIGRLYPVRYQLLAGMIGSALLALVCIIYLCWVAGRRNGTDEIRLMGLTRLPLDLYAGGVCLVEIGALLFLRWLMELAVEQAFDRMLLTAAAAVAALMVVLVLAWIYAAAAQVKAKSGFWWKNTLIGRLLRLLWRYVKLAIRGLARMLGMLPLIWQWLLAAGVLVCLLVGSMLELRYGSDLPFILCLLLTAGVITYVGYAFGVLAEGARQMARGDLTKKVPTKFLVGFFRDSARYLNALAGVAEEAARKQLKSERMKTELITNVSHDIKTPLTSIINFVDLLQKPHTEVQEQEYLEVLDRQSLRLKKLIDDLMEMSKASTGNIHVNITKVDATEAVNQALGEFSDKLAALELTPVVRMSEGGVPIMADGRLVWRILSNLLSNVVKYALPGTRVYVDVVRLDEKVLISVKNISREELNVSAEELMERFVRGDASRNTEGSGLGLNIAKSLMDVQHGLMQLLVDGDLFKVTLIFPAA